MTELRLSTPMALAALSMTVLASWAEAVSDVIATRATSATTAIHFLLINPPEGDTENSIVLEFDAVSFAHYSCRFPGKKEIHDVYSNSVTHDSVGDRVGSACGPCGLQRAVE